MNTTRAVCKAKTDTTKTPTNKGRRKAKETITCCSCKMHKQLALSGFFSVTGKDKIAQLRSRDD